MEPSEVAARRRAKELMIGLGSAAGILALVVVPWWVLDATLIGAGAAALWWARSVPLEQVLTHRARLRPLPVVVLATGAVMSFSAHGVVQRIALLFLAGLLATAAALLVTRWYGFLREA